MSMERECLLALLVLHAFGLVASSDPEEIEEIKMEECEWTHKVKGSVTILDKINLKTLATLDTTNTCPRRVFFLQSCSACITLQSEVSISCQIPAGRRPVFWLEYDSDHTRGDSKEPDLRGCGEVRPPTTSGSITAVPSGRKRVLVALSFSLALLLVGFIFRSRLCEMRIRTIGGSKIFPNSSSPV